MKQEIKAKWTAALRSGEYKQGTRLLQAANGKFCCLGVLCDLHSKETGTEWVPAWPEAQRGELDYKSYLGQNGYLPAEVIVWAGLETYNTGNILVETQQNDKCTLTQINDCFCYSFESIAEVIERSL